MGGGVLFPGYSSYACQSGNRTEVIAHPGSLIFTPSPVQSTRLSLPFPLISARSSPFHLFSLFLPRLLLVTDGVRKTRWMGGGEETKTASHVKCQKTKALKKQRAPHSPVRGRKGGWPKRRDCVIICVCVCVCVTPHWTAEVAQTWRQNGWQGEGGVK